MKKFLLIPAFALALVSSAFATPASKVNTSVVRSLKHDYPTVENIQWTVENDYTKAAFLDNNTSTQVFYKHDGQLIATSTQMVASDLPIEAKRVLAGKYSDYTVTEAISYVDEAGTAYYVSAKKGNNSVVLKVADNQVELFKTIKK